MIRYLLLCVLLCVGTAQAGLDETDWLDLMPEADRKALLTVPELDGRKMLLGGYPVPLESNDKGDFIEFFLVPYPGACIHVPPPPPNQIVFVRYAKGMALEDIYAPIWVEGILKVEGISNELADSAYVLEAQKVELITE